ncbi:MAG TPA: NAD(P)-dependent alcohol dehydrogenase [Acidobacteriaceae bacterium]|nr:NAD(P)-dependent alcohol dehydrogenase [Acidobacteriaceae bacterium]
MKAIAYRRHGGPEVLEYKDIPAPVPADNEVLIRVRAAALNPLDWRMMRAPALLARLVGVSTFGQFSVPGVDVAGVVEAVGRAVTQYKAGDEVFGAGKGSCAEFACALQDKIARKPAELSFEQAASIPIGGLTALQGLRDYARLQLGQKVLINGAAGGVGAFAVQLARWMDAEVTAVCSTRNLELLRSLGAHHAIDYTCEDFTRGAVRYDVIFDAIANHSFGDLRRVMTHNGICVGIAPAKGWFRMIVGMTTMIVMPLFVSERAKFFSAKARHDDLQLLAGLMADGKIVSVIDRTSPLAETAGAMRYLELGHARGKVVIAV